MSPEEGFIRFALAGGFVPSRYHDAIIKRLKGNKDDPVLDICKDRRSAGERGICTGTWVVVRYERHRAGEYVPFSWRMIFDD